MKKLLALSLSLILMLALFSACSPNDDEEPKTPAGQTTDDAKLPQGGDNVGSDKEWDLLGQ